MTHCPRERRPGNRSSPNAIRPLVSQDMAQLCEKQQGVSWTYDGPNGTETLEGNGFNLCDLRGLLQKGLSDFRLSAFERVFDGPQIATFAIAETAAITRPGTIVPSKTPGMIYSSIAPRTAFHGNVTIHRIRATRSTGPMSKSMSMSITLISPAPTNRKYHTTVFNGAPMSQAVRTRAKLSTAEGRIAPLTRRPAGWSVVGTAIAYLKKERGRWRNTARVSLYIDSRVGGSKRFQPPLCTKIITSKGGRPPQRNATYTLEVGISGEGRPTAVGKEKTEISSVSETLPEIWHSRRRKAHRSPFLEWSNYQGDTRHGGPNASTDQS